jgi:hypothetical protein
MEKKGNNSKVGNGIYFKISGYVDLDMLHNFAIKLNIYQVFHYVRQLHSSMSPFEVVQAI